MKEKKFVRWLALWSGVILAAYLVTNALMSLILDDELTGKSLNLTSAVAESEEWKNHLDHLAFEMDPPDVVAVKGIKQKGDNVLLVVEPMAKGPMDVMLQIVDQDTCTTLDTTLLKIARNGTIVDMNTGNFSHYRERQFVMNCLVIAFAVLLWIAYFKSRRDLVFSYHSIFCIGLGIWATLISLIMVVRFISNDIMLELYQVLVKAPVYFAYYTFPVIFIFALLLSVSNFSLIRHEGFRFRNALGILLSVAMVISFFVLVLVHQTDFSGSELQLNIRDSVLGVFFCAYVIMECFLIGSMICGLAVAKHQPAYDKDYIVILGCMIRKDGTLYPLIRGRVDRAIRFYRSQQEATGKKAVFIPSGGQGRREPISEAEAMKRYLLQQGIEEQQIIPEDQSVNTRENMMFSRKIAGNNAKAVFSTTNYHVFRSGIISRQVDFEADGMGSPTKWYFWPNAFVREVIGMVSYKWKSMLLMMAPIAVFLTVIRFVF